MRILNLGAGNAVRADAVNHDRWKHRPEIQVAHDLNILPWPWPDESFDLIIASAVLEHLDIDLIRSMNECWRLLAPRGKVSLKLPNWQSERSWDDPTHRWRFTLRSMDIFDPDTEYGKTYGFYTPHKWKIIRASVMNSGGTSIHTDLEVRK